jgi:hypothetical protein
MNRHERRANEAQARAAGMDKGFGGYRAQARRASPNISDRELGEAWMRGQAWSASGADGMVIHKKGEPAPRGANDVTVSMTYGSLRFKAFVNPGLLRSGVAQWGQVLDELLVPEPKRRGMSRSFILDRLVTQHCTDGDTAGMMVAAIAWLIAGVLSAIFMATDCPYTLFHYEITDIVDDNGRRGQDFRLVLDTAGEPLPDVVHEMPPHPINETVPVHPLPPIEED